jgi:hypothetical protein
VPVDLDECQRYMRQNLPRIFKIHVANAIEGKLREIENSLDLDILSIIKLCQDRLISEYRSGAPIDRGSQSVLSGLETNEATRGQNIVFGGLTSPDTSLHAETSRAMPGARIQPTPPDSGTRPARSLQRIRPGQEVDTPSKPPKNASMGNLQHVPYMDNMYSDLSFARTNFCCCPLEAAFCTCPEGFLLQDSNSNSTMSNSAMGTVGNSAMGNLTMGNAIMGSTTMSNSPIGNATMGNPTIDDSGLEPEPQQQAFYSYGYSDLSNARPR